MKILYIILVFIFLGFGPYGVGQNEASIIENAQDLLAERKYQDVITLLTPNIIKGNRKEEMTGILAMAIMGTNDHEKAMTLLRPYLFQKKTLPYLYKVAGEIARFQGKTDDALYMYRYYLQSLPSEDSDLESIRILQWISTAVKMEFADKLVYLEHPGNSVNSVYDEIHPIFSPNFNERIYFSSNKSMSFGPIQSFNILGAELFEGTWSDSFIMDSLIMSDKQEVLLDFETNGRASFYFHGPSILAGDLQVQPFSEKDKGLVDAYSDLSLPSDIIQGGVSFVNDTILLLGSSLLGGFGGFDLFISRKEDGLWSKPFNLGPNVNSEYDEVSPFLLANGTTLFLSSNSTSSTGGFDVFRSDFTNKNWSQPKNVGAPINSSRDDLHFRVSVDGSIGVFSSDRIESLGAMDIFLAYFKKPLRQEMIPSRGTAFFDQAKISSKVIPNTSKNDTESTSINPRKHFFTSLFYTESDIILNKRNEESIDRAVAYSNQHPDAKLEIVISSADDKLQEYDFYFSLQKGENVMKIFQEKGINPKNIILTSLGSKSPIAKNYVNTYKSKQGQMLNNRIDVYFHSKNEVEISSEFKLLVPTVLADSSYIEYLAKSKGLQYRVKILSALSPINDSYFNEILPIRALKKPGKNEKFEYFSGEFSSFFEANQARKVLISKGFEDAFIEVFINGLYIPQSEVKLYAEKYKDLLYYIYRGE